MIDSSLLSCPHAPECLSSFFFFFKQKTAYEMRISDWSSDVCSSDLVLDKLQEEFDLHDLAIEDARNAHQRPKLEAYGDSLFIVVNTAQVIDERISYGE